ncbi:MAG TPA: septal ring lytic transglycosylase RlpA family protein [Hanamia sp.]|nr:septal ring lytic transglycosylase RlpA family protein [Hanamia sp.]
MLKHCGILIIMLIAFCQNTFSQKRKDEVKKSSSGIKISQRKKIIKFGVASYYADKFNGRKTNSGEIYQDEKFTAACNQLPLNTWIKVTWIKNGRSVIVRINDRLNSHNKRLVDLSKAAAKKLGFLSYGIVRVKIEVLNNYHLNK